MSNKHLEELGYWTEKPSETLYPTNMVQGRPSNAVLRKKQSLALARQVCLETRKVSMAAMPRSNDTENQDADDESSEDEVECTGWSGGVTHYISSDDEPIFVSDSGEEEDVEELSGSELEEVIQRRLARATEVGQPVARTEELSATVKRPIVEPNALSVIMGPQTSQKWKRAESTRSLGYNGQSVRTKRHRAKVARDKEEEDAKLRKG